MNIRGRFIGKTIANFKNRGPGDLQSRSKIEISVTRQCIMVMQRPIVLRRQLLDPPTAKWPWP